MSEVEILANLYSSDNNQVSYLREQINTLNVVNGVLFTLYYLVLIVYIFYIFRTIRYGPNRKMVILLICGLITYPFIIYRVEEFIYVNITTIFDKLYYSSSLV
jgi:hypothetical protein